MLVYYLDTHQINLSRRKAGSVWRNTHARYFTGVAIEESFFLSDHVLQNHK